MIKKERFGTMPDGRPVSLYTIENPGGVSASFTDLGAVWVKLLAPDREGVKKDVLLGFDDADGYLNNGPHFGSVVGRIANRTAKGQFFLNGKEYRLAINNGENNLHSGPDYYDRRLWEAEEGGDGRSVTFTLLSPDGDQGYPGNAKISVTYTLSEKDCVEIVYRVVCDQDTPVNLTNHAYFNLAGHDGGSVMGQEAKIEADFYTPNGKDSIPTGEILKVDGTPMDFRTAKAFGRDIDAEFDQLTWAGGYDQNWCLNHHPGEYALSAWAHDPGSGRAMEVYTDAPGVQLYTANGLSGVSGKGGVSYGRRGAFCFETQFYPDSANKAQFPTITLKAGTELVSRTGYRFYVEK